MKSTAIEKAIRGALDIQSGAPTCQASIAASRLTDYVRVYPNVLSTERCRTLIERFESASERSARSAENGYSFVQLDVTRHWPQEYRTLHELLMAGFARYQSELKLRRCWPAKYVVENMRLKCYQPNGRDAFPLHVDAYDNRAAARFATAIIYLNATEGGETVFPDLGLTIAPEAGKMVVFPPLWMYPHAGLPPRSSPKYILHSYLLYAPPPA